MQEFSSFEELAEGRRRKRQGNKADMERRASRPRQRQARCKIASIAANAQ